MGNEGLSLPQCRSKLLLCDPGQQKGAVTEGRSVLFRRNGITDLKQLVGIGLGHPD